MLIFDNLILAPLRGLLEIAEAISTAARRELEDPEYIQAKLLELQLSYELGEIEEAEYESGYQVLAERLRAARQGSLMMKRVRMRNRALIIFHFCLYSPAVFHRDPWPYAPAPCVHNHRRWQEAPPWRFLPRLSGLRCPES